MSQMVANRCISYSRLDVGREKVVGVMTDSTSRNKGMGSADNQLSEDDNLSVLKRIRFEYTIPIRINSQAP